MTSSEIATFFSGGGKAAKFPTIGTTVAGKITVVHPPEPQTDIKTKAPIPGKTQIRIELSTSLRDPEIENDDGTRTLYVRGWMTGAIGVALRKAGAVEPKVGGSLSVTYIGDGAPTQPGFDGPKQFAAVYELPSSTAASFFNGGQIAVATPPAELIPPGFDMATWAAMPEETKRAVREALPGARVVSNDDPPF